MPPSLTDRLCTTCGLCCDGTLFADVELDGAKEAARMEHLGVEVDEGGDQPVLVQPCTALGGRRCTIYAHRPGCCRVFECELLARTQQGDLHPDEALDIIAATRDLAEQIRDLLHQLERPEERISLEERVQEALSADEMDEVNVFEMRQLRLELRAVLARLQHQIRTHFASDL